MIKSCLKCSHGRFTLYSRDNDSHDDQDLLKPAAIFLQITVCSFVDDDLNTLMHLKNLDRFQRPVLCNSFKKGSPIIITDLQDPE